MAVNTTTFESTLQTKLNDTTLAAKEMLLLGKALESTVGSIAVSDINTAGATKVSEINALAVSTFKTVGGASILGSGDIATLPSQTGASGKVLKSDGTNAAWGTDEGGKILQVVSVADTSQSYWATSSSWRDTGFGKDITLTNVNSKVLVQISLNVGASNDGYMHFIIKRNGVDMPVGNSKGASHTRCNFSTNLDNVHGQNEQQQISWQYLDDPTETTITPLTYRLHGHSANSSMHFNDCYSGTDYNRALTTSTITLMEISV